MKIFNLLFFKIDKQEFSKQISFILEFTKFTFKEIEDLEHQLQRNREYDFLKNEINEYNSKVQMAKTEIKQVEPSYYT